MADRHNQFRPTSNGYDGYHYDGQGESQQFGAPQNDYASAFAAASAQQMRPMGGGGGFGDYSGYGPPSGNSGFYGYGAQQSNGMPASNYQGQQQAQRSHQQQHQQPQGGRGGGGGRGFNPDAPSFQPRQRTSPQGSGSYQQQQRQSNPAGFGFNPFGYQSPRPGFQPHLQQAQARAAYAQAVSPHAGPPHGYHARQPGPPPQYEMMMMGPPGGGYGDADSFGYDSFGDGASPAVASQYALSTELVERMQASANKCALLEIQIGLEQMISEQDFDTWSAPIKDRLASKELQPEDVSLAASLIVEMAVLGTGCQYNFARLCQIIQQSMPTFTVGHLRAAIVEFCQMKAPELPVDPLRNLTSFIAEVYEKIEVNGYRVVEFALRLVEQIQRLLRMQPLNDGIVKTVVQVFKLVGRYLEEDQGPEPVDQLITALTEATANSRDISESAKNQIRQVKQLREKQWGFQKSEPIQSHYTLPPSTVSNGFADVMIFGPDGMPLTEEENAFLEECAAFDSSPAYSGADGDLDGEMLEEYERFLHEQNQATAISIAEKALEKLSVDEDDIPDTPKQTPEKPNPLADAGGPPLHNGGASNKRSA